MRDDELVCQCDCLDGNTMTVGSLAAVSPSVSFLDSSDAELQLQSCAFKRGGSVGKRTKNYLKCRINTDTKTQKYQTFTIAWFETSFFPKTEGADRGF